MTLNLSEMRAIMAQNGSGQSFKTTGNNDIFKFGDLKVGDEIKIRFLPDGDTGNTWFWRERNTRSLKFTSLLLPNGTTMVKDTYVSVPAFNLKSNEDTKDDLPPEYLYKSTDDVIQQKIKGLWIDGDKTSQALYNRFGKKVSYIFQGFVHAPGYETKIYRFIINKDLYNLIHTFLDDDEISEVPCDYEQGRDFILKVSEKNAVINGSNVKVKDYVTNSKWSSRITPLSEEEKRYIDEHGLYDLKKFLPKRPSSEQEEVMLQMYNASYDGNPYDIKNWASTFRPDNIRLDQDGNVKVKEGEATSHLGTEIPQQQVYQPAQPTSVPPTQAFYAQPQQVMQETVQQFQQPQVNGQQPNWDGYNAPENRQMLVDSPIQVQVQQPTAPQIIKENVEKVEGQNVGATIDDIMSSD